MVGGTLQQWFVSTDCNQLGTAQGRSDWCRFPHCPFPPPPNGFPPWSPPTPPPPPAPAPPAPAPPEVRTTCGGGYGWGGNARPCTDPTWAPEWALNVSTQIASLQNATGYYNAARAAAWGLVTFDWGDGRGIWQDQHPHDDEEVLAEQCRRVKALGTGTKCMVYRQTELAVQWDKSCRLAMTSANASLYLQFKTKALCDAAPPCSVAAFHQANSGAPLIPCNSTAPVAAPNCAYCCNFSSAAVTGVYNEPVGGEWPVDGETRII